MLVRTVYKSRAKALASAHRTAPMRPVSRRLHSTVPADPWDQGPGHGRGALAFTRLGVFLTPILGWIFFPWYLGAVCTAAGVILMAHLDDSVMLHPALPKNLAAFERKRMGWGFSLKVNAFTSAMTAGFVFLPIEASFAVGAILCVATACLMGMSESLSARRQKAFRELASDLRSALAKTLPGELPQGSQIVADSQAMLAAVDFLSREVEMHGPLYFRRLMNIYAAQIELLRRER